MQRGNKCLLEQASLTLNPGEHIGLIGVNGSGKSTLLALLRNQFQADSGICEIPPHWRIAHVAQETPASARSARDYVVDGDTELRRIEEQINQAVATNNGYAQAEAHLAYADANGYTANSRADNLLLGLGFSVEQLERPVAEFSGGWRMRLNLAQALMVPADLLLLDEPTNHLDIDAILWLEEYLTRYLGTIIIISHDREFLDKVCQITVHLHDKKLTRYRGNYSSFEEQRAQQITLQKAAYVKQEARIAHLQKFVDRFKAQATKARQAQSRVKALEKIERLAPLHTASAFSFEFYPPASTPNPVMVFEEAYCGYPNAPILNYLQLSIQAGQRIGLLGANGQGKSTLIKSLVGELPLLQGKRLAGKGLCVGYFSQHQLEILRADDTPLNYLMRLAPDTREQTLRDFLGRFNFSGDSAVNTLIDKLSGGEKARLVLASIVWQKPNLLLLDEPTNHLDIETRDAITLALAEFEGTLILVSHDRHLLRATTNEFWLVHNHQVTLYDGDLDDYRDWTLKQKAQQATSNQAQSKSNTTQIASPTSPQKKRENTAQLKTLQSKINKLEKAINELTQSKQLLEDQLSNNEIYSPQNKHQLTELLTQKTAIENQIASAEISWLEHQEHLDTL